MNKEWLSTIGSFKEGLDTSGMGFTNLPPGTICVHPYAVPEYEKKGIPVVREEINGKTAHLIRGIVLNRNSSVDKGTCDGT